MDPNLRVHSGTPRPPVQLSRCTARCGRSSQRVDHPDCRAPPRMGEAMDPNPLAYPGTATPPFNSVDAQLPFYGVPPDLTPLYLAHDCVDQLHTVLFAVTNQRLSNFAVSAISKR